MFQIKKQDKTAGKKNPLMEVSNLPDKGFKVVVIKMLGELGTTMDELYKEV